MRLARLDAMTRGWFVGGFQPTAFATDLFEVAGKRYAAGERESLHHHKLATEITLIVEGRVRMAGHELMTDDIIVLEPGEATDFEAVSDAITVVVKTPSVRGDKYERGADAC